MPTRHKVKIGLLILTLVSFGSYVGASDLLKNYKPNSLDEEKLITLMVKFEQGYSQQDTEKILDTYAPDAVIKTIVNKKDWTGVMLSKNEHAEVLRKQMDFYKRIRLELKIHKPKEVIVRGNEASMVGTYEIYGTNPNYYEKGVCYLDFIKTGSDWLITKRTWEVIECNDPSFRQWKRKQK